MTDEHVISKFSEFAKERKHLIGDKVNLKDILDIPIVVTDFKTDKSKFKCKGTLWLLEEIIRSPGGSTNVPIGNYLSQYLSNLYLSEFDHWLKEKCRVKYYSRYCDDGVILHRSNTFLKELLVEIRTYLGTIGLTLNPKTKIIDVDRCGIDFLGYVHHRKYTLLRKSASRNLKAKLRTITKYHEVLDPQHIVSSIMAYVGWVKHCNSHNLLCRHLYTEELFRILEAASLSLQIKNPMRCNHGRINN